MAIFIFCMANSLGNIADSGITMIIKYDRATTYRCDQLQPMRNDKNYAVMVTRPCMSDFACVGGM